MPPAHVENTPDNATYTTSNGAPVAEPYAAQRVGPIGPLLLQDFHHIDLLAHFDRERIPERVVHAKGAGAHGYFELTHSLSDITDAPLFVSPVGTKVRATARFSTVGGESGSADTARDPRGFSVKLKTPEGVLDWVFNNTPVFFIRDPAKFPHFIHTQKRDPATHQKDADMFWDYLSQNPESVHQLMTLFSDRGTPDGYHNMHGYSGHTFKLGKKDGSFVYIQVHLRADKGVKTFTEAEAVKIAGENPDYGIGALYDAIDKGENPSWTVYFQVMTPQQAEEFRYNIFDLTKIWSHKDYPLRPVGKFVLNENPKNYFAEVEQVAFSPSHLIPYYYPSADPVLQSRLFSYPDTHRHRLGVNYQQLPVNAPINPVANFQRDGLMAFNNQDSRPNYQSTISPLKYKVQPGHIDGGGVNEDTVAHEMWTASAYRQLSVITELDFEQPRAMWEKVFNDTDKEHFIANLSGHIGGVKNKEIVARQLSIFAAVHQDIADRVADAIKHPKVKPLQGIRPASEGVVYRRFQKTAAVPTLNGNAATA